MEDFFSKTAKRKPKFDNILKVLNKEAPDRFTLFEFFMNDVIYAKMSGLDKMPTTGPKDYYAARAKGFRNAGYDYVTIDASAFHFNSGTSTHGKSSRSSSDGALVTDRESFDKYVWNNPDDYDTGRLEDVKDSLEDGMMAIIHSPNGVLENVMDLAGYEGLCYMMADDPDLVEALFENVGKRLLRYYELGLRHSSVGACIVNDDWGFNTQTMLSVKDMKKYVYPWHKAIVETIHKNGRPAIMHSCGKLHEVYEDLYTEIGFDGKHSYEDVIQPVEEAYDMLKGKLAVMGGIDLDYICRKTPEEVYNRSRNMLVKAQNTGGYALGSGNSIPEYVPMENYMAMISAVLD